MFIPTRCNSSACCKLFPNAEHRVLIPWQPSATGRNRPQLDIWPFLVCCCPYGSWCVIFNRLEQHKACSNQWIHVQVYLTAAVALGRNILAHACLASTRSIKPRSDASPTKMATIVVPDMQWRANTWRPRVSNAWQIPCQTVASHTVELKRVNVDK